MGAGGQREGIPWESFRDSSNVQEHRLHPEHFSSDDKFCWIFKSRYSVFQIKTCMFIDCRQAFYLLKAEPYYRNPQILLLERTAVSETSSGFPGAWADSPVGPARAVSPAWYRSPSPVSGRPPRCSPASAPPPRWWSSTVRGPSVLRATGLPSWIATLQAGSRVCVHGGNKQKRTWKRRDSH